MYVLEIDAWGLTTDLGGATRDAHATVKTGVGALGAWLGLAALGWLCAIIFQGSLQLSSQGVAAFTHRIDEVLL